MVLTSIFLPVYCIRYTKPALNILVFTSSISLAGMVSNFMADVRLGSSGGPDRKLQHVGASTLLLSCFWLCPLPARTCISAGVLGLAPLAPWLLTYVSNGLSMKVNDICHKQRGGGAGSMIAAQ